MWFSEQILYLLAKHFYKASEHLPPEMREAHETREDYRRWRWQKLDLVLSAADRYGVRITNSAVLDLGCGDGALTLGYAGAGAKEVVGVDINAKAICRAKELNDLPNVSFYLSGTDSIPLEDERFDVIISFDVFEHISQLGAASK